MHEYNRRGSLVQKMKMRVSVSSGVAYMRKLTTALTDRVTPQKLR